MSAQTDQMDFIAPGATLGVMGGGQLGRMFVHAAQQMGYFAAVLDADADSPAGRVAHHHVSSGYLDKAGLAELSRWSAAITTEFENVPAAALAELAKIRHAGLSDTEQALVLGGSLAALLGMTHLATPTQASEGVTCGLASPPPR